MATSTKSTKSTAVATPTTAVERFNEWAKDIPSGTAETGLEGILSQIAGAGSVEDTAAPWESAGTSNVIGKVITVQSLKRLPSDYADGLGFFLVVTSVTETTGEQLIWTTGAVGPVAQMVKWHANGWLPVKCMLVESEKPTKDGYRPQHLIPYSSNGAF